MSDKKFNQLLRNSLPTSVNLVPEIWTFIDWLEDQDQVFQYTSSQEFFVPTIPVKDFDSLWSHLAFVIAPDLVRFWFGTEGMESQVIPLVRCGGDGSYLALWRSDECSDRYVFLGSEGEAFIVADNARNFLCLLTMGYSSFEGRDVLEMTPNDDWHTHEDKPWPDPTTTRAWMRKTFSVEYPKTGIELVPSYESQDPFISFVEQQTTF